MNLLKRLLARLARRRLVRVYWLSLGTGNRCAYVAPEGVAEEITAAADGSGHDSDPEHVCEVLRRLRPGDGWDFGQEGYYEATVEVELLTQGAVDALPEFLGW